MFGIRFRFRKKPLIFTGALVLLLLLSTMVLGTDGGEYQSNMYATFWALVPPIVAIVLALVTKEVFSSLFVGILAGALFYSNFNLELTWTTIINDGFITKLSDTWNVGILIFLVILGIVVRLMNKAGGAAAYGDWAKTRIKSRRGAMGATFGLGVLIFVDDYFNCLTVGSVMRPVTDKFNISRAKLAFIIDATAAPICMIAPISSWAAAVAGVVEGDTNGLHLFIQAIPYNFYSLLTLATLVYLTVTQLDFGPMARHEYNAREKGDLYTTGEQDLANESEQVSATSRGKVIDLVLPVVLLIFFCIFGMIYTGGIFEGESFILSFANCDASLGLSLGSLLALLAVFIMYVPRRVLSFHECCSCITEGFIAMAPAILILTFAWTLSAMTGLLGADVYVAGILDNSAKGLTAMLPALIFIIAACLAFSTGTSWGTFGILIPIITEALAPGTELVVICISACLAGAVCGDHCSPISDTTIMSSTGALCNHINHVSTQLPYALTVAAVSVVSYVIAGLVQNVWISLPVALVLMIAVLTFIKSSQKKKAAA